MQQENRLDNITLRDYLQILFRYKFMILLCFLTVLSTVYASLQLKTPEYESHVKMLISAEKPVEASYYQPLVGYRNAEVVLTQSEIVKSNPVIERTVKALKLHLRPLDYENRYGSMLKKRLVDFNVKKFDEKLAVLTKQQKQIVLFRRAASILKESITISPVRDTNMFIITVKDFDPIGATILANVVSRAYVIFDLEQQLAEITLKYGRKHPFVVQLQDSIDEMERHLTGDPLTDIEAIGPASVKIIEQASVPFKPTGVNKKVVLVLAFFMGGFLGLVLAFSFEYMDQTFKTRRDIESVLNLSFLGFIPKRKITEGILIRNTKRKTPYIHYYQILSDQLYLMIKDQKLDSILITAAAGQEGTTTIIANLGMYLSQKAGHKVLLIDANFRKPCLHKIFKLKNPQGLADVLEERTPLKKVINEVEKGLSILPAGKTELNPVILLGASKMSEVMQEVKEKYEIILVDCPNLSVFKEAVVLASRTSATVMVVNEGKTRRQIVQKALKSLEQKNTPILGVVLNNRTFPIPQLIYDIV